MDKRKAVKVWTEDKVERLKVLAKTQGQTLRTIAAHFEVTEGAVAGACERNKISIEGGGKWPQPPARKKPARLDGPDSNNHVATAPKVVVRFKDIAETRLDRENPGVAIDECQGCVWPLRGHKDTGFMFCNSKRYSWIDRHGATRREPYCKRHFLRSVAKPERACGEA